MFFWKKESEADKQAKARQAATVRALESGDIPPLARERIEREVAMGKNFFSSDLSCREYLLVREAGAQTLGQVMGTSFFKVGFTGIGITRQNTGEFSQLTQAQLDARQLAVRRLQTEAKLLGADGVIGVRIKKSSHSWAQGLMEFTAIGTAIKMPEWPHTEEPFTSTLNGQEFWQLHNAGYQPLGLVLGVSAHYVRTDSATQQLLRSWWGGNNTNNQEIHTYTSGFYAGRSRAMGRLEDQCRNFGADGAVDMTVELDIEDLEFEVGSTTYVDLLLSFYAMGTAVKQRKPLDKNRIKPLMVYDLSKRSWGALGSTGDFDGGFDYGAETLLDEDTENFDELDD